MAASGVHAALVAPSLAAFVCQAHVHPALVQGVLLSAAGGGCGWLSLALCSHVAAAPAAAAANLVSLLTAPAATLLLCGRGALAAPGAVLAAWGAALCAWALGVAVGQRGGACGGVAAMRACALALLYMECCEALAVRGSVRLEDMLAMMVLEWSWLALSAGACWGYARCGLLAPSEARVVALCALPKGAHVGWQWHAACGGSALARLPVVLLAPAQALLLAAIAADDADADPDDAYT